MDSETPNILEKMAEFIAGAEIEEEIARKKNFGILGNFEEKSTQVDQRLARISNEIKHFREIMARAGAAKLRQEAENLSTAVREETKQIEDLHCQIKNNIAAQCDKLNKASMNTVKNVAQLMTAVRQSDLTKLAEEETKTFKKNCAGSFEKIRKITFTLQWKNLFTMILVSVVTALVINLYISDSWPWQSHAEIIKEREAGRVLFQSWPALSHHDQEVIVQYA